VNTDRDLVLELLEGGRLPAALASNPLARELAGELLELDKERGAVTLAFAPPERYAQGAGVLQGGIVTAMLDFAMAFAAHVRLAADERTFATASLTVQLLRPAPPGRYVARGRIVRAGRKLLFAEADVVADGAGKSPSRDPPGTELIATASAVLPLG
jgi:uncharacterized protein (TIGR00369 family)